MRSVLLAHAARYPMMEPRDAVKLLYQNEFGGGHLIRDEEKCLSYLENEYRSLPSAPGMPLLEEIGNDFFRVNLAALDAHSITPEELGHAFIRSSSLHHGMMDEFLKKLQLLRDLTAEGTMPFSPDSLDAYLAEYEKAGYPPVSHSDAYRNAYSPAYRVVHRDSLPESRFKQMP